MIEMQSATFHIGSVTFDSIQDVLYRLFCLRLVNPTHIFLCQAEYDALTQWICTRTYYHLVGSHIVEQKVTDLLQVSHLVNLTTARAMKLGVSPKLTHGAFSLLWKESEAVQ